MPGPLADALAWYLSFVPGTGTDLLGWAVVLLFAVGGFLPRRHRSAARRVSVLAWGGFALFWLALFPHFAFAHKSYIEGLLALVAVPTSLYTALLLLRGRDSLFVLTRAVAAMGIVYLPFETIGAFTVAGVHVPAPRRVLIETVATQAGAAIHALGYDPTLVTGPEEGYRNAYVFTDGAGHRLLFEIVLACTGLGSMAIFAGLIAAVRAPLRRKARALAVAIPIIYVLNIVRVTFIGIAFGNQYLQVFVDEVLFLFGGTDPYMVSFYLSDRVISQLLAVVALVGVTYLVVRELPELLTVIEDLLYLVTGDEYDLEAALDVPEYRERDSSRSA